MTILSKLKKAGKSIVAPTIENMIELKKIPSDAFGQITGDHSTGLSDDEPKVKDKESMPATKASPIVEAMTSSSHKNERSPEVEEKRQKKIAYEEVKKIEDLQFKLGEERLKVDRKRWNDSPEEQQFEPGKPVMGEDPMPKGKRPRGLIPGLGKDPNIETRKTSSY